MGFRCRQKLRICRRGGTKAYGRLSWFSHRRSRCHHPRRSRRILFGLNLAGKSSIYRSLAFLAVAKAYVVVAAAAAAAGYVSW